MKQNKAIKRNVRENFVLQRGIKSFISLLLFLSLFCSATFSADFDPDSITNDPLLKKELQKINSRAQSEGFFMKNLKRVLALKTQVEFCEELFDGAFVKQVETIMNVPVQRWTMEGWGRYEIQNVKRIVSANRRNPLITQLKEKGKLLGDALSLYSIAKDIYDGVNGNDGSKLKAIIGTYEFVQGYLMNELGIGISATAMMGANVIKFSLDLFIKEAQAQYSEYWWNAYLQYNEGMYELISGHNSWVELSKTQGETGIKQRLYEFWDDPYANAARFYGKARWQTAPALANRTQRDAWAIQYYKQFIYNTLKTYFSKEAEKEELKAHMEAVRRHKELMALIKDIDLLMRAIRTFSKTSEIVVDENVKLGDAGDFFKIIHTRNFTVDVIPESPVLVFQGVSGVERMSDWKWFSYDDVLLNGSKLTTMNYIAGTSSKIKVSPSLIRIGSNTLTIKSGKTNFTTVGEEYDDFTIRRITLIEGEKSTFRLSRGSDSLRAELKDPFTGRGIAGREVVFYEETISPAGEKKLKYLGAKKTDASGVAEIHYRPQDPSKPVKIVTSESGGATTTLNVNQGALEDSIDTQREIQPVEGNLVQQGNFSNFGQKGGAWGTGAFSHYGVWWNSNNARTQAETVDLQTNDKLYRDHGIRTALRIKNKSSRAPHVYGTTVQRIKAVPGGTYRLTLWAAAEDVRSNGAVSIAVDKSWQTRAINIKKGTYGWEKFSGTFKADQSGYIELRIISDDIGTVWLTGLTLTPESHKSSLRRIRLSSQPRAEIKQVWVEHNVYKNNRKGMQIHVNFQVDRLKGKQIEVAAYFHFDNGTKLKDSDGQFKTRDGQVCAYSRMEPSYDSSTWEDFKLFLPYQQLHVTDGVKHQLKFNVFVWDNSGSNAKKLAQSQWVGFWYER